MRTITMLTVVVSLTFGLQAMENLPLAATPCNAATTGLQHRDYRTAADLGRECVAVTPAGTDRASALTVLGIALHRLDRNAEARQALEQALTETERAGPATRSVALGALAGVYRSLGDYAAAERTLRQAAVDSTSRTDDKALSMISLSDLLREEGRQSEAKVLLDSAASLPALSWQRHVDLLVESAEWNRDARQWDASIALWNEADKLLRGRNETHWDGVISGGLGETWFAAGNAARAEPLLRRSVAFLRNDPASASPQVATALATLAALYIAEGKLALADEAVDEAIARDEEALGTGHPQVAAMLELQAEILARRGQFLEARDKLDSAERIIGSHFGADSIAMAAVLTGFGDLEEQANRPDAAAVQYGRALELIRRTGAEGTQCADVIAARYAGALKAAHRGAEAKAVLKSFQSSTAPAKSFRDK